MADQMLQVLQALQVGDNDVRAKAEKTYEDMVQANTEQTVGLLLQCAATAQEEGCRTTAAVLCRRLFESSIKNDSEVWEKKLQPSSQAEVKKLCLSAFESDQTKSKKHLGELIVTLASLSDGAAGAVVQQWPELMPALFRILQAQKAAVLAVLVELVQVGSLAETLLQDASVQQVLQHGVQDADVEVRKYTSLLLLQFASETKPKQWAPILALALAPAQLAGELATQGKHDDAYAVLESLNDIAEDAPKFLTPEIPKLLQILGTIGSTDAFESKVKKMALEVLCTLAGKKKKDILACPQYVTGVVELCIRYSEDLSDDLDEWLEEDTDDEDDEHLHSFGTESLDVFCRNVGGEKVLPEVFPRLGQLIQRAQQGQWKALIAAIGNMRRLAEYVDDPAKVDELLGVALGVLGSGEPRVRAAAWQCVAQFAEDHREHVPEKYAPQVCEAFAGALDDKTRRVVLRAMQAFQLFAQSLDQDTLEPYAEGLLAKLLQHLNPATKISVKAEVIGVIGLLAETMKDGFAPAYPKLAPVVKQTMLEAAQKPETRELFGKCVETFALLGKSAGAAVFKNDAAEFMKLVVDAGASTKDGDAASEYLMTAGMYACETLKQDFAQFLPSVLPQLLHRLAQVKPVNLTEEGLQSMLSGGDEEEELSLTIVGDKVLGIKTAQIEEMQQMLNYVKVIVDEVEDAVGPHITTLAQSMYPVFDFELGEDIRETAFEVWASLLKVAAKDASNKAQGQQLLLTLVKKVATEIETEDRVWELTQANGLAEVLKAAGPGVLDAPTVKDIAQVALTRLDQAFQRRAALAVEAAQAAADESEEEFGSEDGMIDAKSVDIKIRAALLEVLGGIMTHHQEHFGTQVLPLVLPLVSRWLHPNCSNEDQKLGLFLVDDLLDHLGEQVTQLPAWADMSRALLLHVQSEAPELRQAANYGLTLAGKLPGFKPSAADAIARLAPAIQLKAKGKKKAQQLAARDNAVSAFGVILRCHEDQLPAKQQAWQLWLEQLPLKNDCEEACKVHLNLLELVQQQHACVIGEGYRNLPKILGALADVYGTDNLSDEGTKQLYAVLGKLGTAGIAQFGKDLTAKQQKKLERMWKDMQKSAAFSPPARA